MMEDSFKNLTDALQKFDAGEIILPEIVKQFVHFFDQIHRDAEKLSDEKREAYTHRFIETAEKLITLLRPYIKAVPIDDEKLIMSLDNPDFFDPDEWKAVSDAKEKIGEIARNLLPYLSTLAKPEESIEQEKLKKTKSETPKHPPRSKWMKS